MQPIRHVILLAAIFSGTTLIAQPTDTLRQIDQLCAGWNNATPGGAIRVSRNGVVLYNKAFGLADLEHAVPNTTETIFESGSVAKQFTAMAILLLAQEGKLNVKDEIQKYVPEIPRYEAPITIDHLLHHISGLKDWGTIGAISGWPRTTRVYTQDLAVQIMARQKSTNFRPGMEYSYSNSNYSLLVTIVERVSGKSLQAFMQEKFFEPLGMQHTRWRYNFREIIPNRSIAYQYNDGLYQQMMPFENIHGHGGLLTTTADLEKWNTLLSTHAIGGDRVYQERIRRGRLTEGKEISYASGLVVEDFHGFQSISHSGATAGYRAWLAWYPEKKISVVVLSNASNADVVGLGHRIASIYLGEGPKKSTNTRKGITLAAADAERFAGVYRSARGYDVIRLERKENGILSDGHELTPFHRDTLYLDGNYWIQRKAGVLLLQNPYDTTTYRRMPPPAANNAGWSALAGSYYSEEADALFKIAVRENKLWADAPNLPPIELKPVFADGFTAPDLDLYEFTRDKKGQVTGFQLSTSRALHVPFKKQSQKK
ncbi:MAG: beta-lactamase family protein [Bacteroidetes bacterium]|nr:beta-lactamase family protein [Bacteroidota bacterium]